MQPAQPPVVMNFSFASKKRKKNGSSDKRLQHLQLQPQQQLDMNQNQQQHRGKPSQLGKTPPSQPPKEGKPLDNTRLPKNTRAACGSDVEFSPAKKQKQCDVKEVDACDAKQAVAGDGSSIAKSTGISPKANGLGGAAKAKRFILFVGNMPFNTSEDDIRQHFVHCSVVGCRLLRNKGTAVGKGVAFVDFLDSKGYLAALKLNHSLFGGRRINVEPTAGGGGNSSQRMGKIELKKKRLEKAIKGDVCSNRGKRMESESKCE